MILGDGAGGHTLSMVEKSSLKWSADSAMFEFYCDFPVFMGYGSISRNPNGFKFLEIRT
jgi:hypothetical protein